MSGSEISNELGIPQTTLSAPLKSLKNEGLILNDKGKYRINPHRIEEIIDDLKK
jgi:predicted transcriptional regulator